MGQIWKIKVHYHNPYLRLREYLYKNFVAFWKSKTPQFCSEIIWPLVVLRPRPYVFSSSPPSYFGWIFLSHCLTQSNWSLFRPYHGFCSIYSYYFYIVVCLSYCFVDNTTLSHQAVIKQSAGSPQADFKIGCHYFSVILFFSDKMLSFWQNAQIW